MADDPWSDFAPQAAQPAQAPPPAAAAAPDEWSDFQPESAQPPPPPQAPPQFEVPAVTAAPAARRLPPDKPFADQAKSFGISAATDATQRVTNFWDRLEGNPYARQVMDTMGGAFPVVDAVRQAVQGTKQGLLPGLQQAEARAGPSGAGRLAGDLGIGLGLGAIPGIGLLGGGALTGAALSDAPADDTGGFLKDVGLGALTNKVGGEAINLGLRGVTKAVANAATKVADPRSVITGLQTVKNGAYRFMNGLGITYSPDAISGLHQQLLKTLNDFGASTGEHGAAYTMVNRVADRVANGLPMTLTDLEQDVRSPLSNLIGSGKTQTQALATKLHGVVDNFIQKAKGVDLANPGATDRLAQTGAAANKAARAANTRYQNALDVNAAIGGKTGGGYPFWGIDAKAAKGLGSLVDGGFLSPDEAAQAARIANPGVVQATRRAVGGTSPIASKEALFANFLGEGATAMLHQGGLGAAVPVATSLSKLAADAATKAQVGKLFDMMAGGGTAGGGAAVRRLRSLVAQNSPVARTLQGLISAPVRTAATAAAVGARGASQADLDRQRRAAAGVQ